MPSQQVRFEITPEGYEQVETIVRFLEEPQSIIHGIVKDYNNDLIGNSVVKLFEADDDDSESLCPISHTFTDKYGQFLFGPLEPGKKYVIEVWVSDTKVRRLIIDSEGCREYNQKNDCADNSLDEFINDFAFKEGYKFKRGKRSFNPLKQRIWF